MCKRFVVSNNTICWVSDQKVFTSGSKSKASLEKTHIYEIFALAHMARYIPGKTYQCNNWYKLAPFLNTKLHSAKLERNIKSMEVESAFQLLSSIGQIIDEIVSPMNKNTETEESNK